MRLENVLRNKIHQEFIDSNNIDIVSVVALDTTEIGANIVFADGTDMDLVQTIIDAHEPTPIPTISSEEILEAKIENQTLNLLIDLGVI